MASVVEDEDNFAEDECTIEFGEEDIPAVSSSTSFNTTSAGPQFREYPGEDFSKYLSESTNPAWDYDHYNSTGHQVRCGTDVD